ncbi:hypothetical protein FisN_22Lh079 [Fistulifera solaris]|uniref:Sulfotransferase domain-containing protein n=1 Tax=Fistulifera solaris TaxID=1519565 RepID=A0A1Z5JBT2_FISSO|nr:hypothetical protein FisN_22Lh079 [Fistulifera solaris]|eukprot:GAX11406.1 hypothetical protein FisN_22Lh079 [Fistulifera solaris]
MIGLFFYSIGSLLLWWWWRWWTLSYETWDPPSLTTTTTTTTTNCEKPWFRLLSDAGMSRNCTGLPSWQQITSLYGNEPIIVGLERCETYRQWVARDDGGVVPRIAGLYNTGTNALAKLLDLNWDTEQMVWMLKGSYFKWDVPYGKHVPLHQKDNITVPARNPTPKDQVLPIVLIKDPFWWMQSMCRNPYGVKWPHHPDHCPNLVVNEIDQKHFGGEWHTAIAVTTKYTFGTPKKNNVQKLQIHSASLVHLWNDYYREYLDSTQPRLMIRYEDLLYHGPAVLTAISTCVGMALLPQFRYVTETSKTHGKGATDFRQALAKYGHATARLTPLTAVDQQFARHMLEERLMKTFQYQYP